MSNHSVQCVVTQYGVLCTQVSMQHEERSEVGTGLPRMPFRQSRRLERRTMEAKSPELIGSAVTGSMLML
jgi:hypothetical protein